MDENQLPENQGKTEYRIVGENMECNIGAAGKAARLKLGIAAVLGGLILAGIILSGLLEGTIWWLGVAGAIFGGAFAIWEARVGWCVVRAMGFKTPL